jgi:hypothetical protein
MPSDVLASRCSARFVDSGTIFCAVSPYPLVDEQHMLTVASFLRHCEVAVVSWREKDFCLQVAATAVM